MMDRSLTLTTYATSLMAMLLFLAFLLGCPDAAAGRGGPTAPSEPVKVDTAAPCHPQPQCRDPRPPIPPTRRAIENAPR